MKKHTQTLNMKEHGDASNCFQTTLACLLNVEIWEVPNFSLFYNQSNWTEIVNDWLKTNYHVIETSSSLLDDYHTGKLKQFPKEFKNTPYMVSDKSPRGPFHHVVIYKNGKMIHDVYPGGMGIVITENVQCTYLMYLKTINKSK